MLGLACVVLFALRVDTIGCWVVCLPFDYKLFCYVILCYWFGILVVVGKAFCIYWRYHDLYESLIIAGVGWLLLYVLVGVELVVG